MNVTNEEHVIIIIRFKISTYLFFVFTNFKAFDGTRSYHLGTKTEKSVFKTVTTSRNLLILLHIRKDEEYNYKLWPKIEIPNNRQCNIVHIVVIYNLTLKLVRPCFGTHF